MFWHPQTAFILPWNIYDIIEAYTYPTTQIFHLLIGSYLGMEYHPQYWTQTHHLKGIKENHHHQDLLNIHHLLTMLQGGNEICHLAQA